MTEVQADSAQRFTLMANRNLLSVVLLGAVIGGLGWGLSWLLGQYVYASFVCGSDTAAACTTSINYGRITAVVVLAVAALLGLVRLRIFRPLLVVLAVYVSLWGLEEMVMQFVWYQAVLVTMALYALAFSLYVWIVRVRTFWIAAVLSLILIVTLRWVMIS